jgi:hypothetical protein
VLGQQLAQQVETEKPGGTGQRDRHRAIIGQPLMAGAAPSIDIYHLKGVAVPTAGSYDLTIKALVSGTRAFSVSVNGAAATRVSFTGTDADHSPVTTVDGRYRGEYLSRK